MSDAKADLAHAQAMSIAARERAASSLARVQDKLNPKRMAKRAAREVADAGTSTARAGIGAVQRYPATLAAIAAATGLFLARHRIARMTRSATRRKRAR